ncbi:hydrolase [Streptomyces spiroverticillatus]|uniref:Hydrolase n=1 Tax=Streptomyces finlayi TaxID=67296 RepID=A0A918X9P6_9ACTN|nr:FG-GAP-like repeat-containing protein [Streptomyces finlayi]GHA50758.1 hydrolase [Streptomyces spiroverticillatus]GHD19919.1 hydrolase [Streptomyces finlayi]
MRSRTGQLAGITASLVVAGALASTPATALDGSPAAAKAYPFAAQIDIGGQQACTGALVDPQWVITASTCFVTTPGGGLADGKPVVKTTVRLGSSDLAGSGVQTREVVYLKTSEDRNVVLAKLSNRVQGIAPVKVSSTAPAAGETLKAAGFGRTADEWVPDYLHTGDFTVDYADGVALGLKGVGTSVLCKGDTGGPTFRVKDGIPELVGVNSRSWQGGCLGTDKAETRTSAVASRTDDLGAWVKKTTFRVQDDLTRDGIADLAAVVGDDTLQVYPGDKANGLTGNRIAQLGGTGWKGLTRFAKADFTNDGIADLVTIWADGTLHLAAGDGAGKFGQQTQITYGGTSWGGVKHIAAGDFDGDGNADLMAIRSNNELNFYKGDGEGQVAAGQPTMGGASWDRIQKMTAGDFDGDGIADLATVWSTDNSLHIYSGNGDGSVVDSTIGYGGNTWTTVRIMTAGDYTGDGIADLMTVWNDGSMRLYKGNGQGDIVASTKVGTLNWANVRRIM